MEPIIAKGYYLAPGLERALGVMKLFSHYNGKINWNEANRKWAIYIEENKYLWIEQTVTGLKYGINKIIFNVEGQNIGEKYRKKLRLPHLKCCQSLFSGEDIGI